MCSHGAVPVRGSAREAWLPQRPECYSEFGKHWESVNHTWEEHLLPLCVPEKEMILNFGLSVSVILFK